MSRSSGQRCGAIPRTLHLIDLENLVGGVVTADRVRRVWSAYARLVGTVDHDAVVVAVAYRNAAAAWFHLPNGITRLLGEDGPDGADAALVDAVDVRHAVSRFDRVCLASGDHYFAGLASSFRSKGLPVVQVIGAGAVSATLYRACTEHVFLRTTFPASPTSLGNTPVSDVIAG